MYEAVGTKIRYRFSLCNQKALYTIKEKLFVGFYKIVYTDCS